MAHISSFFMNIVLSRWSYYAYGHTTYNAIWHISVCRNMNALNQSADYQTPSSSTYICGATTLLWMPISRKSRKNIMQFIVKKRWLNSESTNDIWDVSGSVNLERVERGIRLYVINQVKVQSVTNLNLVFSDFTGF